MNLNMANYMSDPQRLTGYMARENIVPVKAPPWAKHEFELRRNDKSARNLPGRHLLGKETAQVVLERLGVSDEASCREAREEIKRVRRQLLGRP